MWTATRIEDHYKAELLRPLPYEDCRWIAAQCDLATEELIPDLDQFGANIAGYASSATRIQERSAEELQKGLQTLQLSFLGKFPKYECIRGFFSDENTPMLHHQLNALEESRRALIPIFEETMVATKGLK